MGGGKVLGEGSGGLRILLPDAGGGLGRRPGAEACSVPPLPSVDPLSCTSGRTSGIGRGPACLQVSSSEQRAVKAVTMTQGVVTCPGIENDHGQQQAWVECGLYSSLLLPRGPQTLVPITRAVRLAGRGAIRCLLAPQGPGARGGEERASSPWEGPGERHSQEAGGTPAAPGTQPQDGNLGSPAHMEGTGSGAAGVSASLEPRKLFFRGPWPPLGAPQRRPAGPSCFRH